MGNYILIISDIDNVSFVIGSSDVEDFIGVNYKLMLGLKHNQSNPIPSPAFWSKKIPSPAGGWQGWIIHHELIAFGKSCGNNLLLLKDKTLVNQRFQLVKKNNNTFYI